MSKVLLIVLGIAASALAQILLKKSGAFAFFQDSRFFLYFLSGGLSYVIAFGLYAYILKVYDISKISPVMTIGTMLMVFAAGVFLFGEQVSVRQIVGVGLGLVSILLIV